jgi:hypothetical protein
VALAAFLGPLERLEAIVRDLDPDGPGVGGDPDSDIPWRSVDDRVGDELAQRHVQIGQALIADLEGVIEAPEKIPRRTRRVLIPWYPAYQDDWLSGIRRTHALHPIPSQPD